MTAGKTFEKTISINAGAERIWQIITDPLLIRTWLAEGEIEVFTDWEKTSPIEFRGTLQGHDYYAKGKILELIPGKLLKYNSWNKIEELEDVPENYSIFEFRLEEASGFTELIFTQSNMKAKAQYEHSNMYWSVTLGIIKKMAEKP
ncbi:MAG: SRPBCC family protein [Bacteroidia bacterium]